MYRVEVKTLMGPWMIPVGGNAENLTREQAIAFMTSFLYHYPGKPVRLVTMEGDHVVEYANVRD